MVLPVAVYRINKKHPLRMSLVCKLLFFFFKYLLVFTALHLNFKMTPCLEWHRTSFYFADKSVNLRLFRYF